VVVGSEILLVDVMWLHTECFDVTVFRVTLQRGTHCDGNWTYAVCYVILQSIICKDQTLQKLVRSEISLPHTICILQSMFQISAWRWPL